MISAKHLVKIARKWQKLAAMRRKRISFPQVDGDEEVPAHRGHFAVYSNDRKRFVFPIKYLNNHLVPELLKLAEDEFGLPSSGPITLPCDTMFMDYMVSMIQRHADVEIERLSLCLLQPTHAHILTLSSRITVDNNC